MSESRKPSKQRKELMGTPLHKKKSGLNAHLSKELRKELKKRALQVRAGDKAKIMKGKFKKKEGKITKVNHKKGLVFIEKITRKKSDGTETFIPLKASNLMLIELERKDERRTKFLSKGKKAGES
ncbi:MAG: 50S ribosomal protein L24 [Candidatus Diapherotrites archaeon]